MVVDGYPSLAPTRDRARDRLPVSCPITVSTVRKQHDLNSFLNTLLRAITSVDEMIPDLIEGTPGSVTFNAGPAAAQIGPGELIVSVAFGRPRTLRIPVQDRATPVPASYGCSHCRPWGVLTHSYPAGQPKDSSHWEVC